MKTCKLIHRTLKQYHKLTLHPKMCTIHSHYYACGCLKDTSIKTCAVGLLVCEDVHEGVFQYRHVYCDAPGHTGFRAEPIRNTTPPPYEHPSP